jgi:hypothetical protein
MEEKRNRDGDRRQRLNRYGAEFPLVDENGEYIEEDRSSIPDRRLNNISAEEVDCIAYITEIINREEESLGIMPGVGEHQTFGE